MTSTVVSSDVFLIVTFLPLSISTFSLKFNMIFEDSRIFVAPFVGVDEFKDGLMVSPVVKLNVESELMPAYEAPAVSTMAPLSIKI